MDQGPSRSSLIRSESGIVVNWLLKVSIVLVLIGLVLFEGVAVVLVRATAADTAAKAAQEGGFTYRNTNDLERAEESALEIVEAEGATLIEYSIDKERNLSIVTVEKKAKTLFIHNIGPLERYTTTRETQSAPLPG